MKNKSGNSASSIWFAIQESRHVMSAVILRDVRTRFFDHGLGFLIVPLWPLAHLLLLLIIYGAMGRQAPFGDSLNIFFATGLIPTLAFMYVSRFIGVSLLMNKPMLSFPAVHIFDIIAARVFLETVGAFLTLAMTLGLLWANGDNPWPIDFTQAVFAYLTALLLAAGVGSLVGILTVMFPMVAFGFALFMIVIYAASGTLFVLSNLPEQIAVPLSWNPVLQCTEWMRTAYFPTYSDRYLVRSYPIAFGMISLLLAFAIERFFRLRILE